MSAKLISVKSELAVLRGMCSKDKLVAGTLLAAVDESYFYSPESVELYESIKRHMGANGESHSYRLLIEDPDISETARSHMRDSAVTVTTVADATKAALILNRYRQTRGLYNIAASIGEALKGVKVNVTSLMEQTANAINIVRSKKSTADCFVNFGKNNSSNGMVNSLLYDDNSEATIPTGLESFDKASGGFARGALVTVGANSGGGKSVMASALAVNMAAMGYKVVLVPLEMSTREMTARIIANITNTDLTNILQQRLATNERDLVHKRYKRWVLKAKEKGGQYTIFKPKEDMNIEEIMASLSTHVCDVVIIDYISLLRGVSGDDSWLQLGNVARFAKVNAETTNRVNILLCQVGDDAKIRYARSISEHCVTGNTLIDTSKGLIRIDSLYPNAEVMSTLPLININVKSDGGYRPASSVHYNGIRQVFELTLENGQTIRSTSQHRYRLLNDKLSVEWCKLQHLKVGDLIAVDNTISKFSTKLVTATLPKPEVHANTKNLLNKTIKFNENFAYVLGCLSSDGYLGKYGTEFVASDKVIFDKYVKCWFSVFKNAGTIKELFTPAGCPIWRHFAHSQEIDTFLMSIEGMTGGAYGKYVPNVISHSPKSVICSYLAGLYDGDGSTSSNKVVSLHSVSKQQRLRVQVLLKQIGIRSNIKKFNVIVVGAHSSKFAQLIPLTPAKLARVENNLQSRDFIPTMFNEILFNHWNCKSPRLKSLVVEAKGVIKQIRNTIVWNGDFCNTTKKLPNISYKDLRTVKKLINNSYLKGALDDLQTYNHNRFFKIVSIKKLGLEKVYDLTVPVTENYVANGIVVHNSSNSLIWIAKKEDKIEGKALIKVEQPKSRNSLSFPFMLEFDYAKMRVKSVIADDSMQDEVVSKRGPKVIEKLPNLAASDSDV